MSSVIARPLARQKNVIRPFERPQNTSCVLLSESIDPRLVMLTAPRSKAAACFRSLRQVVPVGPGRTSVIMVTSAQRGEGKTVCAANLALALAELGRGRVLLIDANTMSPQLASLFAVQNPPCWLRQLEMSRQTVVSSWKAVVLDETGVSLLAAGENKANLTPRGSEFASLITAFRPAYDCIVVDTPAMLAGPEAAYMAPAVDRVIFTVRTGYSRASALKSAMQQVASEKIMGTVVLETQ